LARRLATAAEGAPFLDPTRFGRNLAAALERLADGAIAGPAEPKQRVPAIFAVAPGETSC
jgi:hypothetical protein